MGEVKVFIGAMLVSTVVGTPLLSQEEINPLKHPGGRYARQNIQSDIVAHWQGDVGVQFVGIESSEVQQMALAELFSLGQASRIDLKVKGFPNTMFDGFTLDYDSRIVFFEYDSNTEDKVKSGLKGGNKIGEIDFGNANESVLFILNQGLVEQKKGCFARWRATEENVIEGIVIAVSDSVSDTEKQTCFWNLIPTAFGISNVVSLYDATMALEGQGVDKEVVFADRSEMSLQLSAAATCREELDDLSNGCAFRLINGIFSYHGELSRLEVK